MDFRSLFSGENDFKKDMFFMEDQSADDLPDLGALFSVPALPDKPPNPIMDSLGKIPTLPSPRIRTDALPPELAFLASTYADPLLDRPLGPYELWREASLSKHIPGNQALFWDRVRPDSLPDKPSSTPFISEQDHMVYSLARHQSQSPSFNHSAVDRVYLSQTEFLSALRTIVLGTSSTYHIWDANKEKFVYAKAAEGRQGYLIVDGKDELICRSITQRFLTIGTLMRRLEVLLVTLRARSAQDGPTIHAFAHSISTVLTYLREDISRCSAMVVLQGLQLSAVYMQYAIYEDILIALSLFYGRGEDVSPEEYPPLESAPTPLLNHIYHELVLHVERQSARIIVAIFAFTLTNTCRDYLREISHSVGYGMAYIEKSTHVVGERPDQYAMDEVEEEEQADDIFEIMEKLCTEYPSFFPPELVQVLPAAQKSLVLLQEAHPEHPLLVAPQGQGQIHWFWTEIKIEAAWSRALNEQEEKPESPLSSSSSSDHLFSTSYKPELLEFQVFDQAPGSFVGSSALESENNAVVAFRTFINSFPERLPLITPTLPRLASLVFSKLVDHALKLSDALLMVFLSAEGNLNLRAHLELLRSFLLVTLPAFESRLSLALFSDAEEYELDSRRNGTSLYSFRRRRNNKKYVPGAQPWAVGLATDLFDGDKWPPVGTDLGYLLRTVIVDSIGVGENEDDRDKVREEAEYRLGFAIRDLPAGSVKWMDPLSIEALDFLYMDYKPPRALEVLITPDILSKYQRMFAFILRLMRGKYGI
ncbi:hypothetical protein AX14_011748 [Amanita brunnescens Koide BX004]|nr:hypothetical protein AX14_011748 [Amanita brunnescens Koide BX004]